MLLVHTDPSEGTKEAFPVESREERESFAGGLDEGEGAGFFHGAARCGPRRFGMDELHALLDSAADWLWETDSKHQFTWFSEEFEHHTGVAPANVLGRSRLDFMKGVAQEQSAASHLADLEAYRQFRNFVYESADARADARWVSVSGNPRFDALGNFIGYRGAARNVTGIAGAVEELSQARAQLSHRSVSDAVIAETGENAPDRLMMALNVMQDAFGCYDKDGRLIVYNQAMVAMYPGLEDVIRPGATFREIAQASLDRGLSDTNGMDPQDWLRERVVQHESENQSTFRLADGRWLMRRAMRTGDGGLMAVTTDISALKRNEAKLEAARAEAEAAGQRLQSAINALNDGFVLWDKEDRLVACNDAFRRHFPFLGELQQGRSFAEMLTDVAWSGRVADARGREQDWVREQLEERPREIGREIVFQAQDGRWMMRRDEVTAAGDRVGLRCDISEHRRREAELAAANTSAGVMLADMKRALDGMHMGVVMVDADLTTEIINQPFYDLWGLTPEDVKVGDPFRTVITARHDGIHDVPDPEFEAYVASRLDEIRGGDVARRELSRADGNTMIYSVTALSGGKRLVCYYDITELKRREAELAEVSARSQALLFDLQRTLDSMNMGLMLLDGDLNAEVINCAFYRLWNLTPEDLPVGSPFGVGMSVNRSRGMYDYIADADWPNYVAGRQDEVRAGDVAPREFRRADGRTLMYSVTALSGGKRLVCYYDVTDLKQREAELAVALEKSQLAKAVVDGIVDPVFVKDENLRFVMANAAFSRVFGRTPDEIIGKSAADLVSPAEAALFEASERQVFETGASYEVSEDFVEDGQAKARVVRKSRMHVPGGGTYVAGFLFDVTEIKRRERDAEEARKHLATVLDSLPTGVIIYDRDDRFVLANRQLRESLKPLAPIWVPGKSFREAIEYGHSIGFFRSSGDPAIDALYDTDYQAWCEAYMARHRLPHAEFERRNPDGRWFRVIDTRTGDGTFIGVRVDITELKQREEALNLTMSQVELFRRALDELPVSTFIKSADLKLAYVNKAWGDFTGFSPEETVGRTDVELFNLTDADSYVKADAEVWAKGKEKVIEEPVQNRDGSIKQVLTRKIRLVASDGTTYLLGSSMDVSDLKKREDELQKSLRENELFRNLIDNVPVAIYAKRPDLRLLYVNAGWCELTGHTREEAIGKTDIEIFGGGEGEAYTAGDVAVLNSNDTHVTEETAQWADGTTRYQIARKSAMVASDGSLYLIGSTTDVTELKQREKELEEARRQAVIADRAKSEFLANMSHEIRTPMNGVLGMAELLAKSQLTAKQKTFTDIIVKSGNALLTIINDILDFSKIDAGQLVLDPAPFNLAEAVEDVATLVSTRAKEKDLELIVRIEPGLHDHYVGDVGRIRQIITNLLGNAVKFTDRGHVLVDVSGEVRAGHTEIRIGVTDTGIGIPGEKLGQIFEKFSQVDGSSTRRHEGTGLGLAIASRLVTMMHGEIGVESEEGKGSTFWFTMKLPNAGEVGKPRVTPLDVTGARILIVDDNAVNRAILTEQMLSWSFDSCAAEGGEEGIKVLEAAAAFGVGVDCVVLDYQMPGMTGIDVARAVRAMPAIANTPIVLLTSVDQALSNAGFREIGIDAQLIKPARSSILLETIVGAIQRHRAVAGGQPSIPVLGQMVRDWSPSQATGSPPAAAPAAPPVAAAAPEPLHTPQPAATESGHRLDILVAEDNEVNQLVFTQILSETGLSFEIVGNGKLAVESWRTMRPRMILMDVSMPEMNGLQATAAIREEEVARGTRTPIVGVTAHALKGDRERCIEAGMDDYLSKPISPRALLDKVERWSGFGEQHRQAI
jgi:PAS domain S-box-containing protein